jgi:hypothetical protein
VPPVETVSVISGIAKLTGDTNRASAGARLTDVVSADIDNNTPHPA